MSKKYLGRHGSVWVEEERGGWQGHLGKFDWGGGAGSHELALAILTDVFEEVPDPVVLQTFRRDFLLKLGDSWEIASADVEEWREDNT